MNLKKMQSPPIVFQGKLWKTQKEMIRQVCENWTADGEGVSTPTTSVLGRYLLIK